MSASATPTYTHACSTPRQSPLGSLEAHSQGPSLTGPGWQRPEPWLLPTPSPKPPSGSRPGWHRGLIQFLPRGSEGRGCVCKRDQQPLPQSPMPTAGRRPSEGCSRQPLPPGKGTSSWSLSTPHPPVRRVNCQCRLQAQPSEEPTGDCLSCPNRLRWWVAGQGECTSPSSTFSGP